MYRLQRWHAGAVRAAWMMVLCAVMVGRASAHGDDEMNMDDGDRPELKAINAGSKTFHWLVTLGLLLIGPSSAAVLAMAERFHWALVLQYVSTGYSCFESFFLDFPDQQDNHENRTSKGTSWFLSMLLGVTIFVGTLMNGSNWVVNRFYPHLASRGQYSITTKIYKALSFVVVLTGWVRVCMAPVALFGFCYGIHTGQCIAHGIMGSAFILYGFLLVVVLVVPWIRLHSHPSVNGNPNVRSQEFYDSTVMCVWGIVNTFTEHRWGREEWSHGDYQHTSMGIIWWAGGLLGMFLTRKSNQRSFIPALLLIFTGYAMSEHSQHMMISTKVHAMFGMSLIGAGALRVIEISFLLHDRAVSSSKNILSFQYLPPFCLVLAGTLFMSANEEQLELVQALGADHSSYILVVASAAFVIFLWFMLLVTLYLHLVGYDENGPLPSQYSEITANQTEEFELTDVSDEETPQPRS
ncbi:Piso0_003396 [Millerozyma farinosa CBS 7064]|uniref:Piso0_003396 protein n=1 Tax=Pichia sorbitophila (strain ATCC MYA-4447 / BCRC 22081 / CBS 7064 / NBRC 10061 / NRRL Y-12695) TaxID=559304 RepID=G8YIY8_PICSO|nr:Piso0_003396 [Millerozyma farinosa CBS 7064]CCE81048.1 Piso0_003396 [Millerozyma farinosa CBS 7064]